MKRLLTRYTRGDIAARLVAWHSAAIVHARIWTMALLEETNEELQEEIVRLKAQMLGFVTMTLVVIMPLAGTIT